MADKKDQPPNSPTRVLDSVEEDCTETRSSNSSFDEFMFPTNKTTNLYAIRKQAYEDVLEAFYSESSSLSNSKILIIQDLYKEWFNTRISLMDEIKTEPLVQKLRYKDENEKQQRIHKHKAIPDDSPVTSWGQVSPESLVEEWVSIRMPGGEDTYYRFQIKTYDAETEMHNLVPCNGLEDINKPCVWIDLRHIPAEDIIWADKDPGLITRKNFLKPGETTLHATSTARDKEVGSTSCGIPIIKRIDKGKSIAMTSIQEINPAMSPAEVDGRTVTFLKPLRHPLTAGLISLPTGNKKLALVLFVMLTIFLLLMPRPTPRETLSVGRNERRKIIPISLEKFPLGAYAHISIGDPSVKELLHIDTGVELTWVVHEPKSGYNPLKSSSFSYKSCDELPPSLSFHPFGDQCDYYIKLADNSRYIGTLGEETFSFETGLGKLKDVYFGFGRTENGTQAGSGSLGLRMGGISIVQSFGGRFSICIGNFNDMRPNKHFLAFGDSAVFAGLEIPLHTLERKYKIKLTSITINGESVGVEDVLFNFTSEVDSGTSAISLVPDVYQVFMKKFTKKMREAGYQGYMKGGVQCYNGKIPERLSLQFGLLFGNVKLLMKTTTMFMQIDEYHFCLLVSQSPSRINYLGITMFQNHNIGFDVLYRKLYIKRIECHKLYDRMN